MSKKGSRKSRNQGDTQQSGRAGIVVKLKTDPKNPVEIGDIGRLCLSIENQYRRFCKDYPHFCKDEDISQQQSCISVRTVRPGSLTIVLGVGTVVLAAAFLTVCSAIVNSGTE